VHGVKVNAEKMTGPSVAQTARELRERFNQNEIRQLIQELVSCDVAVSEAPGSIGTSRLESKRVALSGECTNSCLCAAMTYGAPFPMSCCSVSLRDCRLPKSMSFTGSRRNGTGDFY
jgi:hypothetical protein